MSNVKQFTYLKVRMTANTNPEPLSLDYEQRLRDNATRPLRDNATRPLLST